MRCISVLFASAFAVLLGVSAAAQDLDDLRIMTEEYPPYNYIEEGRVVGSATELVVEVLKRLGARQGRDDFRLLPWARSYQEILSSSNAVLFVMTRTKEREACFQFVCPVGSARIGVIGRRSDRVVIREPEDFERYRIGVVREDVGHQLMRKLVPEKDLDIVNSSEANMLKLKEGRIDLFVYDVQVADFILTRLGLDPNEFETVYTLEESPLCIAFNKDADLDLVRRFQDTLDALLEERASAQD